jgi:hypothetical protein
MKTKKWATLTGLAMLVGSASYGFVTVGTGAGSPTYASIGAALADVDNAIHVDSNHTESSAVAITSDKTIVSSDPGNWSAKQAGATIGALVTVSGSATVTIEGVTITNPGGDGVNLTDTPSLTLRDCDVIDNSGYGFLFTNSVAGAKALTLYDCRVSNVSTSLQTGAIELPGGIPDLTVTLEDCELIGNTARSRLRGNATSSAILKRCRIAGDGTAVLTDDTSGQFMINGNNNFMALTCINCLFENGREGISQFGGTQIIKHCTFVNQSRFGWRLGNLGTLAADVTIENSIFAGPTRTGQLLSAYTGTANMHHNVITLTSEHPTEGGVAEFVAAQTDSVIGTTLEDPSFIKFTNYSATVGAGSYTLETGSPAISAGAVLSPTVDVDLIGNARPMPVGTNPDCGCYEKLTAGPSSVDSWRAFE